MKDPIQVAIDGPSGAGKSTIARILARQLGLVYLDTGAMYRAVGYKAFRQGIDPSDEAALARMMEDTHLQVVLDGNDAEQRILLDDEDVSEKIRSQQAAQYASDVSRFTAVRERLVEWQRQIAQGIGVVMDGRDIGTHVLPHARYKFFLTASAEERARRRCAQLEEKGTKCDFSEILAQIEARDYQDIHRAVSPLRQAEDARMVDCTRLSIAEVVQCMMDVIEEEEPRG